MSLFHFCLFDRECRADDLHVATLRIGRWQHTFKLPGYKKWWDSLAWGATEEPIPVQTFTCQHMSISGPLRNVSFSCGCEPAPQPVTIGSTTTIYIHNFEGAAS